MSTPYTSSDQRGLVVVTDLDGTLLDADTYAFDAARDALEALRRVRASLVIATSKTRAEVERIATALVDASAFIVENGGAIVWPSAVNAASTGPSSARRDGAGFVLPLGTSRDRLIAELAGMAGEIGIEARGFAQFSVADIAAMTGLPIADAHAAAQREYDEPFVIDDPACLPALAEAAGRRGLRITRGGRFHHLTGNTDKGQALRVLLDELGRDGRRLVSVGLGDAANDLPFLRVVDRPIVIPRPDGSLDPALLAAIPDAERAPDPGPVGWNLAMLAVLHGQTLPRLGAARLHEYQEGGGAG